MTITPSTILKQIAQAVRITDTTVQWFDDTLFRLSASIRHQSREEQLSSLSWSLREVLYTHFYTVGRPVLSGELAALRSVASHHSLSSDLHKANPGNGRLENGWRFVRPGHRLGTIVVRKDGLTVTALSSDINMMGGAALMDEADLILRVSAGKMSVSPGFYVAHSDIDLDYTHDLTRFYINVAPSFAPLLLRALFQSLNKDFLSFDLKVASDISLYHRADVAVLYVPRSSGKVALRNIRRVLAQCPDMVRPAVPSLVYKLSAGFGVADSPPDGQSFGIDRCRIIADALVSVRANPNVNERFSAIALAFKNEGLCVDRPHLGVGVEEIYVDVD
jgi:HopA1 effector protein family